MDMKEFIEQSKALFDRADKYEEIVKQLESELSAVKRLNEELQKENTTLNDRINEFKVITYLSLDVLNGVNPLSDGEEINEKRPDRSEVIHLPVAHEGQSDSEIIINLPGSREKQYDKVIEFISNNGPVSDCILWDKFFKNNNNYNEIDFRTECMWANISATKHLVTAGVDSDVEYIFYWGRDVDPEKYLDCRKNINACGYHIFNLPFEEINNAICHILWAKCSYNSKAAPNCGLSKEGLKSSVQNIFGRRKIAPQETDYLFSCINESANRGFIELSRKDYFTLTEKGWHRGKSVKMKAGIRNAL